ncbi:MAG: ParB N-terminal domain-containing protein [Cellvibrionaceae bacterium]|nr:ParB N-terminal domain-containing protein [Cellvibrionaceae bacterium]
MASLSSREREAKGLRLGAQHSRLVNCIEAGGTLDPIQVIDNGGVYLVVDGHHRLEAYADAFPLDNPDVPVEILPWSYAEALGKGHLINASHGEGLSLKEKSPAALRACVYSDREIKAKELVATQGCGQSVAAKVTRAAKILRQEAGIEHGDSPDAIDEKVGQWLEDLPREYRNAEGRLSFKLDSHGFPPYLFILQRRPVKEFKSDAATVERLAKRMEGMLDEEGADTFRAALKKVARASRRDLHITVHRIPMQEPAQEDDGAEEF